MKKDVLITLVANLSRSEKRHFRLQNPGDGDDIPQYLRLFDLLQEGKSDPQSLAAAFPQKRQLSSAKQHLYRKLLQALQDFHATASRELEVKQLLSQGEILFRKRLYPQAYKLVQKALKLATQFELFPLWQEALRLNGWVLSVLPSLSEKVQAMDISDRILEVHRLHREQLELSGLEHQLHRIRLQDPFLVQDRHREEILKAKAHPLMQSPPQGGFRALLSYWGILALLHKEGKDKALEARMHIREVWKNNPVMAREFPTGYILAMNNLCVQAEAAGRFDILEKGWRDLGAMKVQNQDLARKQKEKWFLNGLSLHLGRRKLAEARKLLEEFESWFQGQSAFLPPDTHLLIVVHRVLILYFEQESKSALEACRIGLEDLKVGRLQDIASFLQVFELLLLYERKNFEGLAYRLASLKRKVNKDKSLSMVPQILLQTFEGELKRGLSFPKESSQSFLRLEKGLRAMQERNRVLTLLRFFDFSAWALAVGEGEPYPTRWAREVY